MRVFIPFAKRSKLTKMGSRVRKQDCIEEVKSNLNSAPKTELVYSASIYGPYFKKKELSKNYSQSTFAHISLGHASGLYATYEGYNSLLSGNSAGVNILGTEYHSLAPYLAPHSRFGYIIGDKIHADSILHRGYLNEYDEHLGSLMDKRIQEEKISKTKLDNYTSRSQIAASQSMNSSHYIKQYVFEDSLNVDEEIEKPSKNGDDLLSLYSNQGFLTGFNSSKLIDGMAMITLGKESYIQEKGLKSNFEVIDMIVRSHDDDMKAIESALKVLLRRNAVSISDIEAFSINTMYASIPILLSKQLRIPLERINPSGDDLAYGYCGAASGMIGLINLCYFLDSEKIEGMGLALSISGFGDAVACLIQHRP